MAASVSIQHSSQWIEHMMAAISRCAPPVVSVFQRANGDIDSEMDIDVLAGRTILRAAEASCAEGWDDAEFPKKAEAIAMECIAADVEDRPRLCVGSIGGRTDPDELRAEVIEALSGLDTLRLRVLALILEEGLSTAEAALVLDLPEWRVHQECASAVGEIRRQVCGSD